MDSYNSITKGFTANSPQANTLHLPAGATACYKQPGEVRGSLVTFSHDGKFLAALDHSNSLSIWDVGSEERTQTLERVTGHGEWISTFRGRALACTSEGQYLAISFLGTDQETVRLWSGETFLSFTPAETPIISAAASPDGKLFATGGWDKKVTLWDVETQTPNRTLEGHTGEINTLAFSADGTLLASGGARNWKYQEDEDGSTLRPDGSYSMFSKGDGPVHYFLADDSSPDKTAKVWEVTTGKNIATLSHEQVVGEVAFSPNHSHLATVSGAEVLLWCTKTWQPVATLDAGEIESLAFSHDGTRLALGGKSPSPKVQLWNVETEQRITDFSGHKSHIESVAFSPDGRLLASGEFNGVIYVWDITSYQ
jgi:WD40 repeat protein